MNKAQLKSYVTICTIPGCTHYLFANNDAELNNCPDCGTSKNTISGGHMGGTKFACLKCGKTWESWV